MRGFSSWVIGLLLAPALCGESVRPEDAFDLRDNLTVFDYVPAEPSNLRARVISALSAPDRDAILARLVATRTVGGETWFDLRGIEISDGDITSQSNLKRICWDHARFARVKLSDADLSGALLRYSRFEEVDLDGAVLDEANLKGADFVRCSLKRVSALRAAGSSETHFRQCTMDGARFDNSPDMSGIAFNGGSLTGAMFRGSSMRAGKFSNTDLTGADFTAADLTDVDFYNTVIDNVDFTDAVLTRSRLHAARVPGTLRLIRTAVPGAYFGDIDISKINMDHVAWPNQDYRVGEELQADHLLANDRRDSSRREAVDLYAKAESIYRSLGQRYRNGGYLREYFALRVRAFEARRKLLQAEPGRRISLEVGLLHLGRLINMYDTSPTRYFSTVGVTIFVFGSVFFVALISRRRWFEWYQLTPDGKEFARDKNGAYVVVLHAKENVQRPFDGPIRTSLTAFELSLEALFRFVGSIIDIPNVLHGLLLQQDMRPIPRARLARFVFSLEAWIGVGLLYFGGRMLLLMVGTQ